MGGVNAMGAPSYNNIHSSSPGTEFDSYNGSTGIVISDNALIIHLQLLNASMVSGISKLVLKSLNGICKLFAPIFERYVLWFAAIILHILCMRSMVSRLSMRICALVRLHVQFWCYCCKLHVTCKLT